MRSMLRLFLILLLTGPLAACDLAQGIFKGGLIIGILVAVIIIAIVMKLFGGRGKAP